MTAYIYDGLRSPFGRHAGALASVRPDDLLAEVMRALIARNPFDQPDYEDVVMGCTNQAGEDARNLARHAGLLAGLPPQVPGLTVNRLCGSGLAAVLDAHRMIRAGEGDLIIAGGAESMSRAPFVIAKSESPYSREFRAFDSTIGARFPNPRVEKDYGCDTMPETADNVAEKLDISREQADTYAARSQALYEKALAEGFFQEEIHPIEVSQGRKKPAKIVDQDEHPRPQSDMEALGKLRPLFDGRERIRDQRRRCCLADRYGIGRQEIQPEATGADSQRCSGRRRTAPDGCRAR